MENINAKPGWSPKVKNSHPQPSCVDTYKLKHNLYSTELVGEYKPGHVGVLPNIMGGGSKVTCALSATSMSLPVLLMGANWMGGWGGG